MVHRKLKEDMCARSTGQTLYKGRALVELGKLSSKEVCFRCFAATYLCNENVPMVKLDPGTIVELDLGLMPLSGRKHLFPLESRTRSEVERSERQ